MDVSIVIPVRNEAARIMACLQGVLRQNTGLTREIIVIDSGSTDETPELAATVPGVRVIRQEAAHFRHGRTRNLGVGEARGQWVVFLNGDAQPADPYWLEFLVRPLRRDPGLAGVFSRHLPGPGCPLYMERDLLRATPPGEPRMLTRREPRRPMHFSTVSAAVPRRLWTDFPFDDRIEIAEDQEWAYRVLGQGYRILYEPRSRVVHSHSYAPGEMYRIKRRVSRASPRYRTPAAALTAGSFLCMTAFLARTLGDGLFILKRRPGWAACLREISRSVAARAATFSGRLAGWVSGARKRGGRG